jgi:antitoxin YefM
MILDTENQGSMNAICAGKAQSSRNVIVTWLKVMERRRDLDRRAVAIILVVIEAIMNEISKYVPITKAKNDLLELIRQIESADELVAVTKNGVPAAVILSMEKYTGLLETLDILSDTDTAKSLRTSIRQGRKGKWLRADEVFRR